MDHYCPICGTTMETERVCPRCRYQSHGEPVDYKYKHFSEKEVVGLHKDLVFKLDRARELFGYPIIITSGFRDPDKNASVGGVKDSAHTKGLAVDIKCADIFMQKKLCWALGSAGFRRIGVYPSHVHCDTDHALPTPTFFEGEYKNGKTG